MSKKTKWPEVRSDPSFRRIECRTDDTFFPHEAAAAIPATRPTPARAMEGSLVFPSREEDFEWDVVATHPRKYQVEAYLEALQQDLIVVLPTGTGKTLIACMVLTRMHELNPNRIGVFVVDRVPLVFQQAAVLRRETGAQVCELCGETKTKRMVCFRQFVQV